jgi:hypothetical protein
MSFRPRIILLLRSRTSAMSITKPFRDQHLRGKATTFAEATRRPAFSSPLSSAPALPQSGRPDPKIRRRAAEIQRDDFQDALHAGDGQLAQLPRLLIRVEYLRSLSDLETVPVASKKRNGGPD